MKPVAEWDEQYAQKARAYVEKPPPDATDVADFKRGLAAYEASRGKAPSAGSGTIMDAIRKYGPGVAASAEHALSLGLDDPILAAASRALPEKPLADVWPLSQLTAGQARSELAERQAARASLGPLAEAAVEVGSSLAGPGLGRMLGKLGGGAIKRAGEALAKPMAAAMGPGGAGSLRGGAALGGGTALVRSAADEATDPILAGTLGDKGKIEEALKNVGVNTAIGAGGGAVIGGLLGKLGRATRTQAQTAVERAGGEVGLTGVTVPKAVRKAEDLARAETGNPLDFASRDIRKAIGESVEEATTARRGRIGAQKQAYFQSAEGKEKKAPMPLVHAMLDEMEQITDDSGRLLPFMRAPALRQALNDMVDVHVVPAAEAKSLASRMIGARVISKESAVKRGIQLPDRPGMTAPDLARTRVSPPEVDPWAAERGGYKPLGPSKGAETERVQMSIVIAPRKLNAEQLDEVTKAIDDMAGTESVGSRAMERLTAAARAARDAYGPNEHAPAGLSALNAAAHREIAEAERTLEAAGVRKIDKGATGADIAGKLKVTEYGSGKKGSLSRDEALRALVRGIPGGQEALDAIAATAHAPTLRQEAAVLPGVRMGLGGPYLSMGFGGLGMRLGSSRALSPALITAEANPELIEPMRRLWGSPMQRKRQERAE